MRLYRTGFPKLYRQESSHTGTNQTKLSGQYTSSGNGKLQPKGIVSRVRYAEGELTVEEGGEEQEEGLLIGGKALCHNVTRTLMLW